MPKTDNAGDVFPPRNLGEATSWGRHVEKRIEGVERSNLGSAQRIQNENRVLTSKSGLLADQMGNLAAQQETLNQQQLALEQQQGDLEAQQQGLAAIVARIPVTGTHSGESSGYTIPTGTKTQISISVSVPEDKTRASVFVYGQAFYFSHDVSSAGVAGWRAIISGDNGPIGHVIPLNMDGKSTSFTHTRNFSVTPGGSFNIVAQTTAGENHGSGDANSAYLHATVTFSN